MCPMTFGGIAKSCFSKRMCLVIIFFVKKDDVYFAATNTVTGVL